MQHAPEPLVAREADIFQSPIETSDRPPVHHLVQPIAAVNANDKGLAQYAARRSVCWGWYPWLKA
jgi:hypothetical protein